MLPTKSPHANRNGRSSGPNAPGKILNKVRSHGSLPQIYSHYAPPRRARLYSEPSQALEQQGFIRCESIGIDEAWNRFGKRTAKTGSSSSVATLDEEALKVKNSRDVPLTKGNKDELPCSFTLRSPSAHSGQERCKSNLNRSDRGITPGCIVQALPSSAGYFLQRKETLWPAGRVVKRDVVQDTSACKRDTPRRKQSLMSVSSYGSALSWASSVPSSLCYQSRLSERGTDILLPKVTTVKAHEIHQLSQRGHERNVGSKLPQWTGRRTKRLVLQEKKERSNELQNQLGRPTDSNDSPYAISSQLRDFVKTESSTSASPTRLPMPLPVSRQIQLRPSIWAPPVHSSVSSSGITRQPLKQALLRKGSEISLTSSVSDSGSSSSTTLSVKSLLQGNDEAQRLWRSLELTLGVDLGCHLIATKDKVRPTKSPPSRIPRLQPSGFDKTTNKIASQSVHAPSLLLTPPPRSSRLPIATRLTKQHWDSKLKENSSLLCQTLRILRSVSCSSRSSDGESILPTESRSYAGQLPLFERTWREDAMQQHIWGERALRIVC